MKKGFFLIATMIFLGAIILVGYQNCGLTGAKKSHTKVTPVNPDAKPTPGIADASGLNPAQAQAASGVCNPTTNVLRFSPQEPAFRVNCAQLEELKTLIAPNILTADYFKSGSILMDTAGNIIQVSIVDPPATPKMVGSVPAQVTALQVVDAGLNTVSLTGGQNLAVVDLSRNYLREEPLLPNDPDVKLDENPVCDGVTAAESCVKSASAPMAKGAAVLKECYTYEANGTEKMYCEAEMTFDGVGNDYDVRGRINGITISNNCPTDVARGTFTEKFGFFTNKSNSVTVEAFRVRENGNHMCPSTIPNTSANYLVSGPTTVAVNPEPAFKVIDSSQSSANGNEVTLSLTYAFEARYAFYGSEGAEVNVYCDGTQAPKFIVLPNVKSFTQGFTFAGNTVCTQPAFSVTSYFGTIHEKTPIAIGGQTPPSPSGATTVTFSPNGPASCDVAAGATSCEIGYKYEVANVGTKSVGIYLNNAIQFCVPNLITLGSSFNNPILSIAQLTPGRTHTLTAKVYDEAGCTGTGVKQDSELDFPRINCAADADEVTIPIPGSTMTLTSCVPKTGATTGTGGGNTNFSFSNKPIQECIVKAGETNCSDVFISSTAALTGLNAGEHIIVTVTDSRGLPENFACIQNNDLLNSRAGQPSAPSWIDTQDGEVSFKAYRVAAGVACSSLPTGNSVDELKVKAVCTEHAFPALDSGSCTCGLGYVANASGLCTPTGAGTGTSGGGGNVNFAFANEPEQTCIVPPGESFCLENVNVQSAAPVTGLSGNQAIIIKVGNQQFGCIGNGPLNQSTIPPGARLSWVGINRAISFKAYSATRVVGATGDICVEDNHALGDEISNLRMVAECETGNPENGVCPCPAGFQITSNGCQRIPPGGGGACPAGQYPNIGGTGCTPCQNGRAPVGGECGPAQ